MVQTYSRLPNLLLGPPSSSAPDSTSSSLLKTTPSLLSLQAVPPHCRRELNMAPSASTNRVKPSFGLLPRLDDLILDGSWAATASPASLLSSQSTISPT